MTSKSKNKGNSWEREISTHLSKIYNANFMRVPSSGAYVGGTNSRRKESMSSNQIQAFKGDIIPPDSWAHWNCEAKNYASLPFHQLIIGSCKQLDKWIEQVFDAAEQDDFNIILIKITRVGKFVVVPFADYWISDSYIKYSSSKFGDWNIFNYDSFWLNNFKKVQELSEKSS